MHLPTTDRLWPLRAHGARPALVTPTSVVDHRELAERIDARAAQFGRGRKLVLVTVDNTVESLTDYLAAVGQGHAVIVAPTGEPARVDALLAHHDPDVVIDGDRFEHRRTSTRHCLHPDLRVLLSTSGSTGSPKLVRLSERNLMANATSISQYLGLTPDDRAVTTLAPHYCYGLSVVHSHLLTGASLVLTEDSVVDPCLWRFARSVGATSFAGVPHSFDLLDASGVSDQLPSSLRYVTVAGGRLGREKALAWAERGRAEGFDLFLMYGQTEATARMAYLPPHLVATRPEALGVAVPGGELRIDPVPEAPAGTGEIVYRGDNVMMGYATGPADLALGPELTELRTGDLGRVGDDGLIEWTGRRSRIAKVFGLRVDLDHLERSLADDGVTAHCVGTDRGLHVFVGDDADPSTSGRLAAATCGLPHHAVTVTRLAEPPRGATGKVDLAALTRLAAATDARSTAPRDRGGDVRAAFALVLDRPDAAEDDSFVGLGGDSLSYVELSVRLGELGIDLPSGWQYLPIREVALRRSTRRGVRLDTSIALRALAIVLIVGTHGNLWTFPGGAHLLLGVLGFNLARFRPPSLAAGLRRVGRIALPSALWIGGVAVVAGTYSASTALLLNGVFGEDRWTRQWQFWFIEAAVWTQLAVVLALAVPRVRDLVERRPFATGLVALAATLAVRFAWTGWEAGATERYTPGVVAWCIALGWCAGVARTRGQRLIVSAATIACVAGFFGQPEREALVAAALLTLVWVPAISVPTLVARGLGVLASASLFVYLTHWQVYPHFENWAPALALLSSLVVGVVAWQAWERGTRLVTAALRRVRTRRFRQDAILAA